MCSQRYIWPRRTLCASFAVVPLIALASMTCASSRVSAQTKPDQPLARFVPSEGLIAFVEFDGLAGHQKAWSATAAHAVLTETTTGAMLKSLFSQLSQTALSPNPNAPINGEQLTLLVEHVARRGFVVGVNQ